MKIGFLSDAHGNEAGLQVCLDFFQERKVSDIFFLGDSVGYFPEPETCLGLLKTAGARCLLGNHDRMLLGQQKIDNQKESVYRIKSIQRHITPESKRFISSFHPSLELDFPGCRVLLVHGNPWDHFNGYTYPDSDLGPFAAVPFDCVIMGHTHRPLLQSSGKVLVINAGSCGLPRDSGNLASCVLLETDSREAEIYRIPFSTELLLERYGSRIHSEVRHCLERKPVEPVTGTYTEI